VRFINASMAVINIYIYSGLFMCIFMVYFYGVTNIHLYKIYTRLRDASSSRISSTLFRDAMMATSASERFG